MSQPSQDLLTQLANLQKQAKTAEQTLQHRNAELLAVQRELSKLQSRFDAETERLLTEQSDTLSAARESIEEEIRKQKKSALLLEDNVASLVVQQESLRKQIAESESVLKAIDGDRVSTQEDLDAIRSDIRASNDAVESLNGDKLLLERSISELSDQKRELGLEVATLQDVLREWQKRTDGLELKYANDTVAKEKAIKLLDLKILEMTQTLENRRMEEESTRDELARMKHLLDERDKNLRIREAKVEIGENKLIQNANLLSL